MIAVGQRNSHTTKSAGTARPPRPLDGHRTRDTFVDPQVKENSSTTKIIDQIYAWFPRNCKVVSGYLSSSDLRWKVNYHWDAMRFWLEYAKDNDEMSKEEQAKLNDIYRALMANPPSQTGHFEVNKIGKPDDTSSEHQIEQRCLALQKLKTELAAYASEQGFGSRKLSRKKVLQYALNPLMVPRQGNHIHGWALDIAGDTEVAATIAKSLGATLVYEELTHCHCEFRDGVKLPKRPRHTGREPR